MNAQSPTSMNIEQHTQELRRSVTRVRVVGALVICAMSAWLTWLHSEIASIDAGSVATMVEMRAQDELPKAADALRDRIAAAAPGVIADVKQRVLAVPAMAREHLEQRLDELLANTQEELTKAITEHVTIDLAQVKREIAARYPDLDEREQLRALIHDCAREYRHQVVAMIAEPAGECDRISRELEARVMHLARNENLSDQERLQREILSTLVELAPRLKTTLDDAASAVEVAALDTPAVH